MPIVAEVLLVALIAWLLSRLFLIIITPVESGSGIMGLPASGGSQPRAEDYAILTRYDPFSARPVDARPASAAVIEAAETTLDISVSGMMLLEGGRGSAIIKSGGAEKTYLVGDEIENGVVLERLEPGRAIISRNGVLEGVTVEEDRVVQAMSRTSSTQAAAGPAATATSRPISLDRLAEIFTLRPVRDQAGRMTGTYVVMPGSDTVAFYATGLADGDIIRRVNNRAAPADPERLFDMLSEFKAVEKVDLMVDRGGEQIAITLNIAELG